MPKKKDNSIAITQVLRCIANLLESPRDRYGRICPSDTDTARKAREEMREYAVALKVPGCQDTLEQCAKVARAVLRGEPL